jgi:hypothetical protein
MLDGELVESALDVRVIRIGIAARCVFVVVVPSPQLCGPQGASESFRFEVERLIRRGGVGPLVQRANDRLIEIADELNELGEP